EAQDRNIFSLTDEQLAERGIVTLPGFLGSALDSLERNDVIREALGSELLDTFIRVKREEWREYANEVVTDWEWRKYYSY
ncbi:MAG: type III glutamate--ammonia ligase, partial [Promethearchaeota archaeon]